MRVMRADAMGLCFGVRDALDIARDIPVPEDVTIWGELVHNEHVLDELDRRGFARTAEISRAIPSSPRVLVTAHGISRRERKRLESAGKDLIDTTCPLVARVHEAARQLDREGYHVIVIGKPGHVEVCGIVGDLHSWEVVRSADALRRCDAASIGVVCQTTFPEPEAIAILAAIRRHNPDAEVRFVDTICEPTKRRIAALDELAPRVEAMVVVGGKNSNNTKHLVQLAESYGVPAFHVQSPEDLDAERLCRFGRVGLTAGTSTLDASVDRVHRALLAIPYRGGRRAS